MQTSASALGREVWKNEWGARSLNQTKERVHRVQFRNSRVSVMDHGVHNERSNPVRSEDVGFRNLQSYGSCVDSRVLCLPCLPEALIMSLLSLFTTERCSKGWAGSTVCDEKKSEGISARSMSGGKESSASKTSSK